MHAASLIMLSWAMIGAACVVSPASTGLVAGVLAILVAVIGLPHGAADHRFARPRLEPIFGPAWMAAFLSGYLLIAAVVVFGWLLAPAATVVIFFLASAWHFGQEEPSFAVGPRSLRAVFLFARGGLVIWVPTVFQPAEVLRILSIAAPPAFAADIRQAAIAVGIFAWPLLIVAAVGWVWQCCRACSATGRTRRVLLIDNCLTASLAAVFATASPLVSFLIYFCGWHSVRGLHRLRREHGESWSQLAVSLAPMTLAAIVLIAMASGAALRAPTLGETLIRATFVGLSAMAIPHILLHLSGHFFDHHQGPRTAALELGSSA